MSNCTLIGSVNACSTSRPCTLRGMCLRSRDHFVKPLPCHVTWHLVYPLFRYRIQNRPDSEIASRNANALAPNAKSNFSIIDAETDYFASRHCWGLNLEVVSYAGVPNAKSSLNSGALIHSYLNLSRIILSNFRSCRTTVQVAHGSSTKSIFRVCRTSVCVELQYIYPRGCIVVVISRAPLSKSYCVM